MAQTARFRGLTQIACRLSDLGNVELVWFLRTCRGAGNSRTPHGQRESVRTTARRMARGSPKCETSVDYWPGGEVLGRQPVVQSAGGPQAEPSDAELAPKARVRASTEKASSAPQCVASRLQGCTEDVYPSAPDFPLRAFGLPRDCARLESKEMEPAPWWDVESECGHGRCDTRYSAAWHSFDTFAPSERVLGLVYRLLLRAREGQLGVIPAVESNPGAARVAFETALRVTPAPVSAGKIWRLLRAIADEVPFPVIRALCLAGTVDLLGAIRVRPVGRGIRHGVCCDYTCLLRRAIALVRVPRLELRASTVAWFTPGGSVHESVEGTEHDGARIGGQREGVRCPASEYSGAAR